MDVRLTPDKGYLHGGECASVTFIETIQLPANVWDGFEIEFVGTKATSRAQADRVDFRTFHFVVPDHGVPETVYATVTNVGSSLEDDDGTSFSFKFTFVDSFTKISNYLPERRTQLAVPLVVALGLRQEPHDRETMDRAFVQFYDELPPQQLDLISILKEAYPIDDGLNLLHFCAEMGLSQFAEHLLGADTPTGVESLSQTWQGQRPVDVARSRAHFAGADDDAHYASVLQLLETRTPLPPKVVPSAAKPPQVAPRPSQRGHPLPRSFSERHPPALPPHEPDEEDIYTDPDDETKRRFRFGSFTSNVTRASNDSGFYTSNTSNTSMSGYADISVERQKATCLGTVQATYDYSGSDEEGMLSLKAGDTIYILSSADDGKWYGIVDDQMGYFYMTFVDHDNIAWRESRQQDVEIQRAVITRATSPDPDQSDVGFLRVNVHDVVKILAMPDSGLYTAELDGRVGYIYDSQVQLIGNQSAQWDQATGDDEFHLQRLPSIYSQPAHLTRVLFKVIAVIDHTLHEPDALPFRAGDRISILDSPDSGIWYGRLRGRAGRLNFSDVKRETTGDRRSSAAKQPPPLPPPADTTAPPQVRPLPRSDPMTRRRITPAVTYSPASRSLVDELKGKSLPRTGASGHSAWGGGSPMSSPEASRSERPPAQLPRGGRHGSPQPARRRPKPPPHHQ
ncbi:uncharacterized protein [Oscarella lobularis]|uniref:uncharacterized protein n=1 Tax=Oscarella lobularis TaxID=121494 RepID=UPI0033131752